MRSPMRSTQPGVYTLEHQDPAILFPEFSRLEISEEAEKSVENKGRLSVRLPTSAGAEAGGHHPPRRAKGALEGVRAGEG